jgi:hypothetical protein
MEELRCTRTRRAFKRGSKPAELKKPRCARLNIHHLLGLLNFQNSDVRKRAEHSKEGQEQLEYTYYHAHNLGLESSTGLGSLSGKMASKEITLRTSSSGQTYFGGSKPLINCLVCYSNILGYLLRSRNYSNTHEGVSGVSQTKRKIVVAERAARCCDKMQCRCMSSL